MSLNVADLQSKVEKHWAGERPFSRSAGFGSFQIVLNVLFSLPILLLLIR